VRRIQRSSSWPPCGACRSCRAVGLRIEVSKETKQEGMVMTPREVTPEVLADQELVKTLLGLRPDALDFKVVYWVAPDGDDVTGEYGGLAARYTREFHEKWIRGRAPADEPLVGSADIQSLADLANSYEVVRGTRAVPFGRDTIIQLAVPAWCRSFR
jgi:hypothetical protein